MSKVDDKGNLHDGAGRFEEKRNSAPAGGLAAGGGSDELRPLAMIRFDPPGPGGYDLAVDAPTGRSYLRHGVLHREDGPAYEGLDGTKEWRRNGRLHRVEGPAVESDDYVAFWRDGEAVAV